MYTTNSEMMNILEADYRVTDEEKEAYAEYVRNKVLRSLEKADNGGPVYTTAEVMARMKKIIEDVKRCRDK